MLNDSLVLGREGQIELEGIWGKGGGTFPTGDDWSKTFPDIFATRSTMQIYHYLLKLLKLGFSSTAVYQELHVFVPNPALYLGWWIAW